MGPQRECLEESEGKSNGKNMKSQKEQQQQKQQRHAVTEPLIDSAERTPLQEQWLQQPSSSAA